MADARNAVVTRSKGLKSRSLGYQVQSACVCVVVVVVVVNGRHAQHGHECRYDCLGLLDLRVCITALTLSVGQYEAHLACRNLPQLASSKGSLLGDNRQQW